MPNLLILVHFDDLWAEDFENLIPEIPYYAQQSDKVIVISSDPPEEHSVIEPLQIYEIWEWFPGKEKLNSGVAKNLVPYANYNIYVGGGYEDNCLWAFEKLLMDYGIPYMIVDELVF